MNLSFAFKPFKTHTELNNGIILEALNDPTYREQTIDLIKGFIRGISMYNNMPILAPQEPGDVLTYYNVPVFMSDFESKDKNGLEKIGERAVHLYYEQKRDLEATKIFYDIDR